MNITRAQQARIACYLVSQYTRINLTDIEHSNLHDVMKKATLNIPDIPKNSCNRENYKTIHGTCKYTVNTIVNTIDRWLNSCNDESWHVLFDWYLDMTSDPINLK
jgi:hypothetical protein